MEIWQLLIQFVFRLIFGLTLAMAITSPRHVTSGYFRVHLWVALGLSTFAALAAFTQAEALSNLVASPRNVFWLTSGLAVVCYIGSVVWLYERPALGRGVLSTCFVVALFGAYAATPAAYAPNVSGVAMAFADLASSGLLLGSMMAAMLLGHWYLNTPTMDLMPLRRLVRLIALAVALRMLVSGMGLILVVLSSERLDSTFWIFVAFRWLGGLIGPAILTVLTWYTLKVPNTQSATGILYAGVTLTFLGELTSQLLSADTPFAV